MQEFYKALCNALEFLFQSDRSKGQVSVHMMSQSDRYDKKEQAEEQDTQPVRGTKRSSRL